MKKKIIPIIIVLVVVVSIAATLVRNKKAINANNKVVDRSEVPVSVTIKKVSMQPVSGNLSIPAVLAPNEEATISAAAAGKIASLSIDLGSKVTKGEIIGTIDTKQKQINLESQQLTVDKLQKDYDRNKDLLKGNAINETAVTDAEYNYRNNKLMADQTRQQIADANIVAPISGTITDRKLLSGEYANVGTVIASVVDVNRLKASVFVNEKNVYSLAENDEVTISSDVFPGKSFKGKITFVSPKGDDNHNYKVEVLLNNMSDAQLKAGTYVRVEFKLSSTTTALQIPKNALVEGVKNPYVYLSKGNKAVKQTITVGREIGENIEVLSGLNEGDEVIVDGQINLIDGSFIEKANK